MPLPTITDAQWNDAINGAAQDLESPVTAVDDLAPLAPVRSEMDQRWDQAINEVYEERDRETQLNVQQVDWNTKNDLVSPERRAEVLRYTSAAPEAGLGYMHPADVEKNLDQVKAVVDSAKVNWARVAYRQPELVKWLAENPIAVPVVKDDAANLEGISWAIGAGQHAFYDAVFSQWTVLKQFAASKGADVDEASIENFEREFGNVDYGDSGILQKGYIGGLRALPMVFGDIAARIVGGVAGAAATGAAGAGSGAAAGAPAAGAGAAPGAVIGAGAGGVGGAVVGQYTGSALFNYYQTVGPLYWRLSRLQGSDGKLLDPEIAHTFAEVGAVMNGALMSGLGGKWVTNLPGVKSLMARVTGSALERAMTSATVGQAVKRGLFNAGKHVALGGAMMAGAASINQLSEEMAKSSGGPNFEAHYGKVVEAGAEGFVHGIEDMWILSTIGPFRETLGDIGRSRAVEVEALRLEGLINAAQTSKSIERSPEAVASYVESVKEGAGAAKNVYIPAEEWTRYWQSKQVDPAEAAKEVVGDDQTYADAVSTRGDVAIPIERFVEKLARTEHALALKEHTKLSADTLTLFQEKERQKTLKKKLEQEATARGAEFEADKKQVHDFVRKQAEAGGTPKDTAKANADLMTEFYASVALRSGLSIREVALQGGLGELRAVDANGKPVAPKALNAMQEWLASPSAWQQLTGERLRSMSPENLAREYYIDPVTGVRDARAFNATEVPEGMQVGAITLADTKPINDHPTAGGHDVSNQAFTVMGKALFDAEHPEVARAGTTFLVHVRDAAELQALVERATAALGVDLNVLGEIGADAEGARKALSAREDALRKDGTLPPRGESRADITKLDFSKAERAKAEVPPELVERVREMDRRDHATVAYLDTIEVDGVPQETGLLSRVGWDNIPRKPYVAALDAKGLKLINETYGKEVGNAYLFDLAALVSHYGGSSFDAAHLSGDEFALQHSDPVVLEQFVAGLQTKLNAFVFETEKAGSGKRAELPIRFRYGLGTDYGTADRDLNARKRAEGQADGAQGGGSGDGRGDLRRDRGPQDTQGQVQTTSREGLTRGQGAQPQGYGAESRREGSSGAHAAGGDRSGAGEVPQDVNRGPGSDNREGQGDERRGVGSGTGEEVAAARAYLARTRLTPERKAQVAAFLDYAEGKAEKRPKIDTDLEQMLADRFGVVDPINGFTFGEDGRDMAGRKTKRKVRGDPNLHLHNARVLETGRTDIIPPDPNKRTRYKQEPVVAVIEGQPVKVVFPPTEGHLSPAAAGKEGTPENAVLKDWLHENYTVKESGTSGLTPKRVWTSDNPGLLEAAHENARRVREAEFGRDVPWHPRDPGEWTPDFAGDLNEINDRKFWEHVDLAAKRAEKGDRSLLYSEGTRPGMGERGYLDIRFGDRGEPEQFDLRMLAADRSTFMHEASHFLGWSFHKLATSELTTPELTADYTNLLKWMGYESPAERIDVNTRVREVLKKPESAWGQGDRELMSKFKAAEERLSNGFEQYLLEGRAPSRALARTFSRFKDWLTRIYRGVAGIEAQYRATTGMELRLSNEVRGIFGRLLAGNEALEQARQAAGAPPLPERSVMSAMTPEEREAYRQKMADANVSAEQDIARAQAEMETGDIQRARAEFEAEVTRDLDRQPVFRAIRYLQHGELVDENGVLLDQLPEPLRDADGNLYKVNRKSFVEAYGESVARKMPGGTFARTKKGGVPVDQLAPLLGFPDGDALVKAIVDSGGRDAAIEQGTQQLMDARYGPVLERIAEAAMSAVHNTAAAEAVLLELRSMAKQVDPRAAARVNAINLDVLRETAENLTNDTRVGQLDPDKFARFERQAAVRSAELWGRGDREEALDQREARLFNSLLYRAARDARVELENAFDKLSTTSEAVRAKLGKADPTYRDVHDSVLAAVGIGDAPTEGRTLDQLLQKAEADAATIDFDVDFIRSLIGKPIEWTDLTVDQARLVADAVKNIKHIAYESLDLVLDGQRQSRDAWFSEWGERLKGRASLPPEPFSSTAQTLGSKVRHLGRGIDALLSDVPETYSHILDAGERSGPVHRLLVDARLEARAKETELAKSVLGKVLKAWENVPAEIRDLRDKHVDVAQLLPIPPELSRVLSPVYTRDTLWMLFLNWGNDGNRQRIRDSLGWTDANVLKALSLLSKPELDFLQGVAETIGSLYPELAAVHERRTGLPLGKVEAAPFEINGQQFPGHYFPLKYRSDVSKAGELQAGDAIKALFAPNYVRPSVLAGHRKARAGNVVAVPDLQWGVVPAHLGAVVHDIAYGDWVRQTGSVLFDPRWKPLVLEYLGKERADEVVPWLRDVANARNDSGATGMAAFTDKLAGFARNRAALAVMGLNLPSIAQQILDPLNAAQEGVPVRHIGSGAVQALAHLTGAKPIAELALSKELAYRDAMLSNNMRQRLAEIGPSDSKFSRIAAEVAFKLYEYSDRFTSRAAWKGAFDAALSDGMSDEQAAKRADDVVRRVFASHDIAERPPIMRSKKGVAALVMFYSFANRLYNSQRRSFDDLGRALGEQPGAASKSDAIASAAAKLLMLGATGVGCAYLAGRGPKKDEDPLKWAAWKTMLEPFNTIPFVGGALESTVAGHKVSMRTSPELALLQDVINRLSAIVTKDDKRAEDLISALMVMAGLPGVTQVGRTGGYLRAVEKGEARPKNAIEAAGGVIYGDKDRRNPLSDLGAAIEK